MTTSIFPEHRAAAGQDVTVVRADDSSVARKQIERTLKVLGARSSSGEWPRCMG